jgi:hypothetical protein
MVASVWKWNEVKTCAVSNAAYDRGYGTPEEIVPIRNRPQDSWSTDLARCLNNLISKKGETPAISLGRSSDRLTHNAQGNQS